MNVYKHYITISQKEIDIICGDKDVYSLSFTYEYIDDEVYVYIGVGSGLSSNKWKKVTPGTFRVNDTNICRIFWSTLYTQGIGEYVIYSPIVKDDFKGYRVIKRDWVWNLPKSVRENKKNF